MAEFAITHDCVMAKRPSNDKPNKHTAPSVTGRLNSGLLALVRLIARAVARDAVNNSGPNKRDLGSQDRENDD